MKKLTVVLLAVIAALALPTFAYADIAAPGVITAVRYLPYIVIAVVVIVIAVLIAAIRKRKIK